ncbi:MAG: tRNA (N6-isopentenyl adenosine(37)-C2)-methylthiotransferase MiaB [Defluviitaleaceae bacterium]|nr:tRNA (N6-isopentenyl adenosine(37)-C2)-methylthiotransferase MiaB [Defluviitaleaceae bacterium]
MEDFRYKLASRDLNQSFFIRTYGCQMNERDSEKMAGLLVQMGFSQAATQDAADLVIYNTCCVRESAEDKVFGHLSVLRRQKKERKFFLAVGGCMPQQPEMAEKLKSEHKYIDLIFGTTNRHRLPEFLWRVMETGERVTDISEGEKDDLPEIPDIPVTTREFSFKAGVNIMYGCDNFCSFCIVPYVRGREKSRPAQDILQEIRALSADGVKEIMLLGQNVNSYAAGLTFPELLREVNAVEGLQRIRFMTSHPKDFSDELISAIKNLPKVCKSVHLPLQSGSTRVLADMNRKYSKEDYISLTERLKIAVPGIAITTDIIVGYPGETEEDFADTLDVVKRVRFSGAFTFIYSKRSGTPAAERTDLIPRKTANERFDRLTAELYPIMAEINAKKIGRIFDILIEETQTSGACKGRTDDNTLVHFSAPACLSLTPQGVTPPSQANNLIGGVIAGEIVSVRAESAKSFYVSGSLL